MGLADEYVGGRGLQTASSFARAVAQWAEAAIHSGSPGSSRALAILVTDASSIALVTVVPFNSSSPHDRDALRLAVEAAVCAEAIACAVAEADTSDTVSRQRQRRAESADLVTFAVERSRMSSRIDGYSDGDEVLLERIRSHSIGSGSLPAASVALRSAALSRLSAEVTITQWEAPVTDDEIQALTAALSNADALQAGLTSALGEVDATVLQLSTPTVQTGSPLPSPPPLPKPPPSPSPAPPAPAPLSAEALSPSAPQGQPLAHNGDGNASNGDVAGASDGLVESDGRVAKSVGMGPVVGIVVVALAAMVAAVLYVGHRRRRRRLQLVGRWLARRRRSVPRWRTRTDGRDHRSGRVRMRDGMDDVSATRVGVSVLSSTTLRSTQWVLTPQLTETDDDKDETPLEIYSRASFGSRSNAAAAGASAASTGASAATGASEAPCTSGMALKTRSTGGGVELPSSEVMSASSSAGSTGRRRGNMRTEALYGQSSPPAASWAMSSPDRLGSSLATLLIDGDAPIGLSPQDVSSLQSTVLHQRASDIAHGVSEQFLQRRMEPDGTRSVQTAGEMEEREQADMRI